MAKKRKASRKGKGGEEDEDSYEFPMPDFDEEAFMRGEIQDAYISFITLALAAVVGVAARAAEVALGDWRAGWIPLILGFLLLKPLLTRAGYGERVEDTKKMLGNWFLLFFTWLGVWVLLSNAPFA